jgi:hypothetical protein
MKEFDQQPKPAARVASLLKKFDLLPPRKGNAVEVVKKRFQVASRAFSNPRSGLSKAVELLRESFETLKRRLAQDPPKVISQKALRDLARRRRIAVQVYARSFHNFCHIHQLAPTRRTLAEFERSLRQTGLLPWKSTEDRP